MRHWYENSSITNAEILVVFFFLFFYKFFFYLICIDSCNVCVILTPEENAYFTFKLTRGRMYRCRQMPVVRKRFISLKCFILFKTAFFSETGKFIKIKGNNCNAVSARVLVTTRVLIFCVTLHCISLWIS